MSKVEFADNPNPNPNPNSHPAATISPLAGDIAGQYGAIKGALGSMTGQGPSNQLPTVELATEHGVMQRLESLATFVPGYNLIHGIVSETQQALADKTPLTPQQQDEAQASILAMAGSGGFVTADPVLMQHMTPDQIKSLIGTRLGEAADLASLVGIAALWSKFGGSLAVGAARTAQEAIVGVASKAGEATVAAATSDLTALTDGQFQATVFARATGAGYQAWDLWAVDHLTAPADIARFATMYAKEFPEVAIRNLKFATGPWQRVVPGTESTWQSVIDKLAAAGAQQ